MKITKKNYRFSKPYILETRNPNIKINFPNSANVHRCFYLLRKILK